MLGRTRLSDSELGLGDGGELSSCAFALCQDLDQATSNWVGHGLEHVHAANFASESYDCQGLLGRPVAMHISAARAAPFETSGLVDALLAQVQRRRADLDHAAAERFTDE